MCGIAGIFNYKTEKPVDIGELRIVRDNMASRGPDGSGEWISGDKKTALGHRRLAIIDLRESASQPMASRDGSIVIVFNGEIYNYRELQKKLGNNGRSFRTNSDAEVLLALYQEKGEKMLDDLRGMFAFAIWDEKKKRLFAARDPFGIKPLYYCDDGASLYLASQVKALLRSENIKTAPSPAGHTGFFLFGHIPEPYTLYKNIRALPAGSYMLVEPWKGSKISRYCDIKNLMIQAESQVADNTGFDVKETLRASMLDTVRHHLVSDVPVGLFLSSGMDSTALLALMSELSSNQIRTVTLGFEEFKGTSHDEPVLAEAVARRFNAKHLTVRVSKNDFNENLPDIMNAMDQPTIDGINSYFVAMAAKKAGLKVAVSGLGGDELFGSYPSFTQIPRLVKSVNSSGLGGSPGRVLRKLSMPILNMLTSPKYAGLAEYGNTYGGAYLLRRGMYMPYELDQALEREMFLKGLEELDISNSLDESIKGIESEYLKVSCLELTWYMKNQLLRDTDWAGMAHSVEVRTPFVDIKFLKNILPLLLLKNRPHKSEILKTAKKDVPADILNRPKTGFSVPVREWMCAKAGLRERGLRSWGKAIYSAQTGRSLSPSPGKVLFLASELLTGTGGIKEFNNSLNRALLELGKSVEIVAKNDYKGEYDESSPGRDGFSFYPNSRKNRKTVFVKNVISRVLQNRPDLIVCGHVNFSPLCAILNTVFKIPYITITYGADIFALNPITKSGLKASDKIVAISGYTRKNLIARVRGLHERKIHILPCTFDHERFTPGEKPERLMRKMGFSKGDKVLLTVARLAKSEKYKGYDKVIAALKKVVNTMPEVKYIIAGKGDDLARIKGLAERNGLSDKVIFPGFVSKEELPDYYRLCDLFIMPSKGEGFGIVFLEALSSGKPVIAGNMDGSVDALLGGEVGLLVNPDNIGEIAEAILEILSGKKCVNLNDSSHLREKVIERFSFQKFKNRLSEIIMENQGEGSQNV